MRITLLAISLFLLSACTPKIFKNMEKVGKVNITKAELYPIFVEADTVQSFNMEIDYKENNFAGMLLVSKGERPNSSQLIFTSYFGMTVFDFEINSDSLVVNRCLDQMNKKMVISTLEKDLRTLFLYNVPETMKAKKYQKGTLTGYKAKANDGKAYYMVDDSARQLLKVYSPACIKALQIDFKQYEQGFPSSIEMEHPKIGLKMKIEKLK